MPPWLLLARRRTVQRRSQGAGNSRFKVHCRILFRSARCFVASTCHSPPPVRSQGFFTSVPGLRDYSECRSGTVAPSDGSSSCESCPLNAISVAGTRCVCAPGYAGTLVGATGVCSPCPPNTFGDGFSSVCTSCPVNSSTPLGVVAVADAALCECDEGHFTGNNGTCETVPPVRLEQHRATLPPRTLCATSAAHMCRPPPQGFFASGRGRTSPSSCPPGTISHAAGAASCDACPANSIVVANSTRCECSPGFEGSLVDGRRGACVPCRSGFFREAGDEACLPCPENSAGSPASPSAALCICKYGFFRRETGTGGVNSWECTPCAAGASLLPLPLSSENHCPCLVVTGAAVHCCAAESSDNSIISLTSEVRMCSGGAVSRRRLAVRAQWLLADRCQRHFVPEMPSRLLPRGGRSEACARPTNEQPPRTTEKWIRLEKILRREAWALVTHTARPLVCRFAART